MLRWACRLWGAMDGILALAQRSEWAVSQFGAAESGDRRRTKRLVTPATQMAGHRSGGIAQQAGCAAEMNAAYRLFGAEGVTHAAICGPHFAQTRRSASQRSLVFLVRDTCELNCRSHARCEGLGPIGRVDVRGLHQQNVLAVDPQTRRLEHTDRLEPLIGLLRVLAVWLLQLKYAVEEAPESPVVRHFDTQTVRVMAAYLSKDATRLKVKDFWRGIGLLGGHMGRQSDGTIG